MKIIKRNGTEVPYDYRKIQRAIEAANDEMAEEDRLTDTRACKLCLLLCDFQFAQVTGPVDKGSKYVRSMVE